MQDWNTFLEENVKSAKYRTAYLRYIEKLSSDNFPIIFCFDHLSELVGIERKFLSHMVMQTKSFYRKFSIPKRSGGIRTISAPYASLLHCQRWIGKNILSKIPIHEAVHGFISHSSIITNAEPHLESEWLLKIDIKDFFPSIGIPSIVSIFKQCGYARDVSFFLARLCTLDEKLPQGSATSPTLSNIVFSKTDNRLANLANSWNLKYTRYADDMTFSGHYIPAKFIGIVYNILESEGFLANTEKTRLIGQKGRKIVTGISVSGKKLKLPKVTKRQVRKEVFYLLRFGFEQHTDRIGSDDPIYVERLLGKLTFWKQVEPQNKYVDGAITSLRTIQSRLNSMV